MEQQHGFLITLYGRPGCHLCDDVERSIRRISRDVPLTLHLVNIEENEELLKRFMFTIPAVEIDGEEAFASVESVVTEWELRDELARRTASSP